jgi:hypothetical protein
MSLKVIPLFEVPVIYIEVKDQTGQLRYSGDTRSDASDVYRALLRAGDKPKQEISQKLVTLPSRKPNIKDPEHIKFIFKQLPVRIQGIYHLILSKKPIPEDQGILAKKYYPDYFLN